MYSSDFDSKRIIVSLFTFLLIVLFIASTPVQGASGNVNGIIENEIGQSVSSANVTLYGDGLNKTVNTDVSGSYEFKNIPYGKYNLKVNHTKYKSNAPESITISTTNSPVSRDFGPDTDNPVIRKTGYVTGQVSSSPSSESPIGSGPIDGYSIVILSHSEDDETDIDETRLKPKTTIEGSNYNVTVPTGDVEIKITQDGYSERIESISSVSNNEVRNKDVELVGQTSIVEGTIKNTKGDPIPNANVSVNTDFDIYPSVSEITDVSDASGRYSFKVPDSTTGVSREISADASTFNENSISVNIPPATNTDITLTHSGNDVTGKLVDNYGNNLKGVSVDIKGYDHSSITTAQDGSFAINSVPIGTHDIEFNHPDYSSKTVNNVEVKTTEPTNIDSVQLNRDKTVGFSIDSVTPDQIQPGETATITYTHTEDVNTNVRLKVSSNVGTVTNKTISTDNNGQNTVDISGTDVPDGNYNIEMTALGKTVTDSISIYGEINSEGPNKIQEETIRTPAGDFVNIETSGRYMIIGGDNEQGTTKQHFDVLKVSGGTAMLNTRLIGTNTSKIEADAYNGLTSYEQTIGADSEPKGEFSDIRFEDQNGNKIADTLAEFRDKIGIDSRKAPLQSDRYRLVASDSGRIMIRDDGSPDFRKPKSRSNLVLTTNQEIGEIKTYVLPPGDIDEGVDNLIQQGTETDQFARGERLIIEVPAIGIWGSILSSPDDELKLEDINRLLDRHEGVEIDFSTHKVGGPNQGTSELKFDQVKDSDIRVVKEDSTDLWDESEKLGNSPTISGMYIIINTRGSDPFTSQPEDKEELKFKMSYQSPEGESYSFKDYSQRSGELPHPFDPKNEVTSDGLEHFPYFGDSQTTISSSKVVTFREPKIEYSRKLQNGDLLVSTGNSDVIGNTTMAPGSKFTIQFIDKSPPNQELVTLQDVTVNDGRNFETSGDFSTLNPGDEARVELYSQGRIQENRIVDTRNAVVVENLENPARYNIELNNKNVTVEQRYSLKDINATITNGGNLKGNKKVQIYIDDKIVYEENIILDSGESKQIDLRNKFVTLPVGEYEYTVSSEFDQSTGKLMVKAPESGVIITEEDTNQTTTNSSIPPDTVPSEYNETEQPDDKQQDDDNIDNIFALLGIKTRDALIGTIITGGVYILGEFV